MLDEEVRQLIDNAHRDVTTVLTHHRDRLETLARALLKDETLDELDAYAAAQRPPRVSDTTASVTHPMPGDKSLPQPRPASGSDAAVREAM